jgi:hypothetical protein
VALFRVGEAHVRFALAAALAATTATAAALVLPGSVGGRAANAAILVASAEVGRNGVCSNDS